MLTLGEVGEAYLTPPYTCPGNFLVNLQLFQNNTLKIQERFLA